MRSQIDPSQEYEEKYSLESADKNFISDVYCIKMKGKYYLATIGVARKEKHKIIYYPVYLVGPNDTIETKVGVYEVDAELALKFLDDEGDLDLGAIGDPLLFSNVTANYLKLHGIHVNEEGDVLNYQPNEENKEETGETGENEEQVPGKKTREESQKERVDEMFELPDSVPDSVPDSESMPSKETITVKDIFTKDVIPNRTSYPAETLEEAKKWVVEYATKKSVDDNWIQKFMENKEYHIFDNEGSGDCFFSCIRDAYATLGLRTDVAKLRTLLSQEVTQDIVSQYQALYRDYQQEIDILDTDIKNAQQKVSALKKHTDNAKSKALNRQGLEEAKKLSADLKKHKANKEFTLELAQEFDFMKTIHTIDQFRDRIRSSDYWADTWAISTIERLLNIKVIILEEGTDPEAMLQCGQLNDENEFYVHYQPEHYIMVSKEDAHYRLVSYRKNKILSFSEIPYALKFKIVEKCMQRNAGPYAIIPAFKQFQIDLNRTPVVREKEEEDFGLYDSSVVFMVHASSAPAKPGHGSGERIVSDKFTHTTIKEKDREYYALNKIEHWRRKLSDQYVAPFELDDKRWATVYHYLIAAPFKDKNPQMYDSLSMNSNSELSKSVEAVKKKKLKLEDSDRKEALNKRFAQNADLTTILKETKTAKITIFQHSAKAIVDTDLMMLRKSIQDK